MFFSARVGWLVSNKYAIEIHRAHTSGVVINENLTCASHAQAGCRSGTYNRSRVCTRPQCAEALIPMMLLRLAILNQSRLVLDRPKGETIKHE